MRIGLVGDTHGSRAVLALISRLFKNVDLLFHTGDHWQDGLYLQEKLGLPVYVVKGNCDWGTQPQELEVVLAGQKFFLTHGHLYHVKRTLQPLFNKAKALEADYCLFGHTHRPLLTKQEGIYLLNPGSMVGTRGEEIYAGIILELRENKFACRFVNIDMA